MASGLSDLCTAHVSFSFSLVTGAVVGNCVDYLRSAHWNSKGPSSHTSPLKYGLAVVMKTWQ